MSITRVVRLGVALAAVAVSLGAGSIAPHHAFALYTVCRSDPYLVLSDLTDQVDLSANISDSLSDIQSVNYVVHIPSNLSVVAVVNTDSLIGLKEHVTVYRDEPKNTFDSYTTVYTGARNVPVVAYSSTTVLPLLGTVSVSGYNGQALHNHLTSFLSLGL